MSNRIAPHPVQSFFPFSTVVQRSRSINNNSPLAKRPSGDFFNGNPSGISCRTKLRNKKLPHPQFSPAYQLEKNLRSVVRVPRTAANALSRTLVQLQGVREAKKLGAVRVQVDPVGLE